MDILPILAFLALLALNVPVAIAIAAGALVFFFDQTGLPLPIYAQRISASSYSFPLLAIPMFTLAGVIMNHAGITRRLLNTAEALVGHMIGAIAQANIVLATLMGGLSGSGYAEAAMQSKMLGIEMVRRGYRPAFAAAIVAASSVITPIIPPGLGFIIYGYLADVSIGRLFVAGIVPGLMLMVSLMVVTHFLARRYGYARLRSERSSPREVLVALREAIWALTVPVFIIVGLRYGIFTPTEAGAVTVVYAALVGIVVHRELKISALPKILTEATYATATIMIIICAADAFGFYMTLEQIPVRAAQALTYVTSQPLLMLLLINAFLLIVGMFIESVAALILLTPIFVPLITQLGIDPVHFGLLMVLNLAIGALTPPVGGLMFITCAVLDARIVQYFTRVLPLLAVELLVLLLLTVFPDLVTFLPDLVMGKSP